MEPILSLKNVVINQGDNFRLSISNLELFPKRIYALTGANGSGKSTLLRALAFLQHPHQGSIHFNGGATTITEKRQQITLVEQTPYLLKGTVYDNLAYGLQLRKVEHKEQERRIQSALEQVDLTALSQRNVEALSGGEVHRVALARALALEPKIILLDEPTSNIDNKSLHVFETLLRKLPSNGVTVVFSTHDSSQPERLKSEIIRIDNGQLINADDGMQNTTHDNLKENMIWQRLMNVHES